MTTEKFDIQQFDGHINFGMWKVCIMVVFTQQNLKIILDGKNKNPATIKMADCEVFVKSDQLRNPCCCSHRPIH